MNWRRILLASFGIGVVAAGVVFGPAALQDWREHREAKKEESPSLQTLIESGEIRHLEKTDTIVSLLPYESISLETTGCFGNCPIFHMTFYRDGHAIMISDHIIEGDAKKFTGKIWAQDYARLTQLVSLARAAAKHSDYAGTWTDDSTSIIRAKSGDIVWEVSDYGRVSPPEVWALDLVLRQYRDGVEWLPSGGG